MRLRSHYLFALNFQLVKLVLQEAESFKTRHLSTLHVIFILFQVELGLVDCAEEQPVDARVLHGGQALVSKCLLIRLD